VDVAGLPGVIFSKLTVNADERGRFAETMRASSYPETFVQSNHSRSAAGVLRGLHYHRHQADLWYVVQGRARVGLADLRTRSEEPATATVVLSGNEPATLYIPAGVAHGFLAETAVDLIYWVTNYYDASDEHGVAWNDPTLAVDWGTTDPILSDRDESNPELRWDDIPPFT
jgi:dTDP-4-dehydrorhamnose 3,5-epimerase